MWRPLGAGGDQASSPGVEAQLRQATQDLLDAIAPGRIEVWRPDAIVCRTRGLDPDRVDPDRITCSSGKLISERTGRPATTYRPETADVFFAPGQSRTRRIFLRDATGAVTGFVDRREGHDIRWPTAAEE